MVWKDVLLLIRLVSNVQGELLSKILVAGEEKNQIQVDRMNFESVEREK